MSEFSKSALKQFRRMNKEEMLRVLVELSNYAEHQKAMSMILISRMKELEKYVPQEHIETVNKLMKGEQIINNDSVESKEGDSNV